MNAQLAAAAATAPVRALDNAWSTDPRTLRRPRELRISAFTFLVAGRGGVLGDDAGPDVVAAALGSYAPDAVRVAWEAAGRAGPSRVAQARLAECAQWGDEHLAGADAEELAELAGRVVAAADPGGLPHFAAARAVPVPGCAAGGRAAVQVHRLRELRSGAMIIAARACGLSTMEALVASPDGEEAAVTFGWDGPFPPRLRLLRRYAYAEAVADRLTAGAFASLDVDERARLVELLEAARVSASA